MFELTDQDLKKFGRVIHGKNPEDFRYLSHGIDRNIVMVVGPETLESMNGKKLEDVCLNIFSYQKKYFQDLLDKGHYFKLILFSEDDVDLKLATWDNVINVAKGIYPLVADKIEKNRKALKSIKSFRKEIQDKVDFNFLEVVKEGKENENFMTYEKFQKEESNLINARSFFYFTFSFRAEFVGSGLTEAGYREYIMSNRALLKDGDNDFPFLKHSEKVI